MPTQNSPLRKPPIEALHPRLGIELTPKKQKIATREETLEILTEQARKGSIAATVALERALRALDREANESVEDELDRILNK